MIKDRIAHSLCKLGMRISPPVVMELPDHVPVIKSRGADLEVWEDLDHGGDNVYGVLKPNRVRVNGVELMLPSGDVNTPLTISKVDGFTPLTATVTFFVKSIKVHGEGQPVANAMTEDAVHDMVSAEIKAARAERNARAVPGEQ